MGSRRALTSTIHRDQPSRLLQLENELLNIVLQQLSARDLSCVSSASRELEEPAKYVLVQRALMDWTDPADALLRSKLQGKTNFFEKRVSEYQKSGVMNSLSSESERKVNRSFSVEVDF